MENGGPRTGKGKCGVPKDMQGQSGPEGVPRDNVPFRKGTRSGAEHETCDGVIEGPEYERNNTTPWFHLFEQGSHKFSVLEGS
jgi:hypothetical protein